MTGYLATADQILSILEIILQLQVALRLQSKVIFNIHKRKGHKI